jgi:glutamate-5-semialdehyde dehydrogenase
MNALNVTEYTHTLGLQAKTASALMARAPAAIKNKALKALARLLRESTAALQIDNARDLERARAAGLAEPMVDRLQLSPKVWKPAPRAASSWPPCPTSLAKSWA